MNIDIALIKIALIFLPGVIWSSIEYRWAPRSQRGTATFVLKAFIYGLVSYAVLYVAYSVVGLPVAIDAHESAYSIIERGANLIDVLLASALACIFSILSLYARTYKWSTRFLQAIGATNRFGDEDVWGYVLNSNIRRVEFVHVRDLRRGLIFAGWVRAFSEDRQNREVALEDVEVFDLAGNSQY